MHNYVCSHCGVGAMYDGRCGDGPVLVCGCDKGEWINDGRGGYHYPTGATAIQAENYDSSRSRNYSNYTETTHTSSDISDFSTEELEQELARRKEKKKAKKRK